MQSRLLDRGREIVLVYPEVLHVDNRGNRVRIPAEVPIKVRVTTSEDRSSDAELPGQVTVKIVRCLARKAPLTSWARIVYDGEEWDLAAPPRFTKGLSKATEHVEFTIRSRSYNSQVVLDG